MDHSRTLGDAALALGAVTLRETRALIGGLRAVLPARPRR